MRKKNLNTLHIGIEFEAPKTKENYNKLLKFSYYLNTIIEINTDNYEVQTKPIPYNNKKQIYDILTKYNYLNIKPNTLYGTHIHFSTFGNLRKTLTTCNTTNTKILEFLISVQENIYLTKIMGRPFNKYTQKFNSAHPPLPTKLLTYSKHNWINITQYTIEFRLPILLSLPQYINTINLCYYIYKEIENISN